MILNHQISCKDPVYILSNYVEYQKTSVSDLLVITYVLKAKRIIAYHVLA